MNTDILLPLPELKQALSGLNKLVSKKSTLPVLSHVRITRQTDGLVKLQGTDLDAFATFTLNNSQQGEVVDVLIPLEQLNKAYKCSGSKDPVALVFEDKSTKLRYSIGGSPVNQPVNTLPVKEWPPSPSITAEGYSLPPTFGEALKQALECCSDNPSRLVLNGACLDARDPKAHYIVGTNGRFLFSANSFIFAFKEGLILPNSKFLNGSGLLDGDSCSLTIQPSKKPSEARHICLQNGRWKFVTREIEGQYPNWKQVLPNVDAKWTKIKLEDAAIDQMLKVIPNLPGTDTENNTIRLRTDKNCFWVEGRSKEDKDWTSVAVKEVTITGQDREINLNRDYFLPVLKFGLSELAILDELTPIVCSGSGKKMVIMPVRPPEQTKVEPTKNKPAPTQQAPTPPSSTETMPTTKPAQERKTEMTKATTSTTTTPPATKSPESSLLNQIESVKESAKNLVRDLTGLSDAVKQAEKDKRANEKELENARSVLKKLQQVTI